MTLKHLVALVFGLFVTVSVVPAQTKPAKESQADQLRANQLRALREHVLSRTLESIKRMDEAGLRLSARNQILTYLTSEKRPSDEKQALATQIAREGLEDLRAHGDEIAPFMRGYLANDLRSWIEKHRPKLTEDFEKAIKEQTKIEASQQIGSLFALEGGDVLAARRIRQELEERGAWNGLYFWLDELMKRKSKEFEPLASDIVARARQGQVSFETLFWISNIYLRPQTSGALRNSFLAMVVGRTQPVNFVTEPAPQMAYDLLTEILPSIRRSLPELYDQALTQHVAMRAAFTERQVADDARLKRFKESANPIEDLISEADSVKSKTERNELLFQAAQLALDKKKFELCLDTLGKVDVSVAAADPDSWQRSIDQILKKLVRAVLADKHAELADKAAARVGSPLTRVEALNLIMRYHVKANEKSEAQRLLTEASKAAASASNETHKAKAFFLLSVTAEQVDPTKQPELLLAGVNALNNLTAPDVSTRDKTIYQQYVQRLDNAGYELTKGFTVLTKQDENSALALVEKLQKRDLKTFALIGILQGLDGLLLDSVAAN